MTDDEKAVAEKARHEIWRRRAGEIAGEDEEMPDSFLGDISDQRRLAGERGEGRGERGTVSSE